jgi:hypothetical protein
VNLTKAHTGDVDDTGTLTAVWAPTDAIGFQIKDQAVTGGLTEEEHAAILAAAVNTQAVVPAIGAPDDSVVTGIANLLPLLASPQLLHVHACRNITGQGSLSRGASEFRSDSLGFEIHFVDIPPGFGRRLGSVDEYFNRVVQFRTIRLAADSTPYQDEVLDLVYDGQRHSWGVLVPETLEWYVAPGCVVEICFLVLFP